MWAIGRIRFSPGQAPYVMERHWHDSQKFHTQEDGSMIRELQVANLWEVRRWLIGWGADAEALAPRELVLEIGTAVSRLNQVYYQHTVPAKDASD